MFLSSKDGVSSSAEGLRSLLNIKVKLNEENLIRKNLIKLKYLLLTLNKYVFILTILFFTGFATISGPFHGHFSVCCSLFFAGNCIYKIPAWEKKNVHTKGMYPQ